MSGLEIYGAVVATGGLIKLCKQARDCYKEKSNNWESFDRFGKAAESLYDDSKSSYNAINSLFAKYRGDIEPKLGSNDRKNFSDIIKETTQIDQRCMIITKDLKRLAKKDKIDVEKFKDLRKELESAVGRVQGQLIAFNSHISMLGLQQSFRSASISGASNRPRTGFGSSRIPGPSSCLENGGSLFDSSGPNGSGGNGLDSFEPYSEAPRLNRIATGFSSASTIDPLSPAMTTDHSSVTSAESRGSIKFIKSERLQSAVQNRDLNYIDRIIESKGNDTDSYKATALLHACRYKKIPVVQHLLSMNPSANIYSESGMGLVHLAIGTSRSLDDPSPNIIDILSLLVNYGVSLSQPDKSSHRRNPLHYCVVTQNIGATKHILGKKPETIDPADRYKRTPLYLACEDHSPNPDLIQLLLAEGATFGRKHRCPIRNRDKRDKINCMLDKAESRRPLTDKA